MNIELQFDKMMDAWVDWKKSNDSVDRDFYIDMRGIFFKELLDQKKPKKSSKRGELHKHGEYKHVKLSDSEYKQLKRNYGADKAEMLIKMIDEGKEMKGYKYKNDYLAITNTWAINNGIKKRPLRDIKDDELRACLSCLERGGDVKGFSKEITIEAQEILEFRKGDRL